MKITNPYFFIVGCPRSGTTMLASLLDKHTKIAVPPETHFFDQTVKIHELDYKLNHHDLIKDLENNFRIQDIEIDYNDFTEFFVTNYESTYKGLFQALSDYYINKNQKSIFGEKTPNHLLHIDEILKLFPHAKIILIVRDGRDVVMSLKAVPWIHNDVKRLSYLWNNRISYGNYITKKYSNNVYKVYYESILDTPKEELKKIMHFLDMELEEQQLDSSIKTSVMPEWEKAWKANINKQVTSSNKSRWKEKATREEKCIMNYVMKHSLKREQYKESNENYCTFLESILNRINYLFFGTKITRYFVKIKKKFVNSSITKPELNVINYLKKNKLEKK
jgi:hypothetical protein